MEQNDVMELIIVHDTHGIVLHPYVSSTSDRMMLPPYVYSIMGARRGVGKGMHMKNLFSMSGFFLIRGPFSLCGGPFTLCGHFSLSGIVGGPSSLYGGPFHYVGGNILEGLFFWGGG